MNPYKLALVNAAVATVTALKNVVEVTTAENREVLTPVTGSLIIITGDLLDLVAGSPPPAPLPMNPPATAKPR